VTLSRLAAVAAISRRPPTAYKETGPHFDVDDHASQNPVHIKTLAGILGQ
jgi:hypothetical protein